ncbi:FliA/WhiG family RNA polymerase sigma factor [Termitidicoccus mucosus]|uniref:RNA polymerase subunit sigma-28 n=1 Tax=Termitidicoccus mucosus TaxID=1184151 RepID=A0A178IHW0_9BACT|nr:RNA polymerase subunit sigma-28 [Opitutaceae bacterium TSB47]
MLTALPEQPTEEKVAPARPVSTAWRAYQDGSGDDTGLIERHLPLVRNVVDRIKVNLPAHVDVADLYSVGVIGLMAALRRFNPEQGSLFSAYASLRIRGAVLDELRRLDWCPRRARVKARKIKEAIAELEQRHGRPATDEEVREHLGLSAKNYARWLEESSPVTFVAIDQPMDNGESLHDIIPDKNGTLARDTMEKDELKQLIAQRMTELPDIQKRVLAMYYFENMRLAEIAAVFHLTESRICQIHSQAVLALRAYVARVRDR